MIDADALKKQIEDFHCKDCDNYNFVRCRACWVDDTITYLEEAPTIGGWISVKDRLPNDNKPVYVWLGRGSGLRSGIPFIGKYDPFSSGAWWIWGLDGDRSDIIKVTHWMPLPEPPEEVSGDD